MITIDEVRCLHGTVLRDEDNPGRDCEECADLLQVADGREFLLALGMGVE